MYSLKIDSFCHVMPLNFKKELFSSVQEEIFLQKNVDSQPSLWDMDRRRRIMDRYEGLRQIISIAAPPIEQFVSDRNKSIELARLANDEMAELVHEYPDYFIAAVACLPIHHIDAALEEIDRAVLDLKFRGVLIHTPVNDKPLDLPQF